MADTTKHILHIYLISSITKLDLGLCVCMNAPISRTKLARVIKFAIKLAICHAQNMNILKVEYDAQYPYKLIK